MELLSSERAKVFGDLTIRGITREIILDTELSGRGKDPMGREVMSFDITLPAPALRSSGLLISGSGLGRVTIERLREAMPQLLAEAASGTLRIETEPVPLAEIEAAWQQQTPDNRRLVVLP